MTAPTQEKYALVATTIAGLEDLLASELQGLGAEDVQVLTRAVRFKGPMSLVYRSNYWCRTAFHILRLIGDFSVRKQNDLYTQLHDIRWEHWMKPDHTLAVHAVASRSVFSHTKFLEQRAKDAIVDRFRKIYGRRPSVDLEKPYLPIHIYLSGETCQVFIDSSGESLHKRGYRKVTGKAPLNEVLAAGLIHLTGWDCIKPFYDPMCGSGTLLIEAALIALNLPAGKFRKTYAFQNWPDFRAKEWQLVLSEGLNHSPQERPLVYGADISTPMIRIARQNIRYAGLEKFVAVSRRDFRTSPPPVETGLLVTNPPFGERLPVADLRSQYIDIGDTLKKYYAGWSAWLLASDRNAIKFVGLRPSRKLTVYNGPLECKFVNFDVFKGSRKDHLTTRNNNE